MIKTTVIYSGCGHGFVTEDGCPVCAVIARERRIEKLEAGVNRAGALAMQKASHEIIRQVLAETLEQSE